MCKFFYFFYIKGKDKKSSNASESESQTNLANATNTAAMLTTSSLIPNTVMANSSASLLGKGSFKSLNSYQMGASDTTTSSKNSTTETSSSIEYSFVFLF